METWVECEVRRWGEVWRGEYTLKNFIRVFKAKEKSAHPHLAPPTAQKGIRRRRPDSEAADRPP